MNVIHHDFSGGSDNGVRQTSPGLKAALLGLIPLERLYEVEVNTRFCMRGHDDELDYLRSQWAMLVEDQIDEQVDGLILASGCTCHSHDDSYPQLLVDAPHLAGQACLTFRAVVDLGGRMVLDDRVVKLREAVASPLLNPAFCFTGQFLALEYLESFVEDLGRMHHAHGDEAGYCPSCSSALEGEAELDLTQWGEVVLVKEAA